MSVAASRRHARGLGLLLAVATLVVASGLGLRDPWPADEPRFALMSKFMLDTGEWLFMMRGDEPYSDKPPVFMWLQAAAITLMGGSLRLGFLLPSLLAALGTLWLVHDLGSKLWNRRVGLWAAWMLLFCLQFTFQAKRAQIDMVLLFLMTLANHGLLLTVLGRAGAGAWPRAWFAAGLGTITKAVGGLTLLVLLPAAWARRRGWRGVVLPAPGRWGWGVLAFALAAAIWLGPLLWSALGSGDPAHRDYLHTILFHQTVNRYTDSWHHIEPFWYHLTVVATLWLPAALALPWAIPAWWRRLRRRDARYLLPLAWIVMVLVFFSIPSGKRDVYILPALPMFCLVLAPLAAGLVRRVGLQRLLRLFVGGLGLVLLAGGLGMLLGDPAFEQRLLGRRGYEPDEIDRLALVLGVCGAWMLACIAWARGRRVAVGAAWALAGLWVFTSFGAYPVIDRYGSPREVMANVARLVGPQAELAAVAWREQHLLLADRPIQTFGFGPQRDGGTPWAEQWRRAAAWQSAAPDARWIFVLEDALPDCVDRERVKEAGVTSRRRWLLVPAAAVPPGCGLDARAAPGT